MTDLFIGADAIAMIADEPLESESFSERLGNHRKFGT
jgi:hypothetical protein